jgi:hypothetical protein
MSTLKLVDLDGIAEMLKVQPRQAGELYRDGKIPGIK